MLGLVWELCSNCPRLFRNVLEATQKTFGMPPPHPHLCLVPPFRISQLWGRNRHEYIHLGDTRGLDVSSPNFKDCSRWEVSKSYWWCPRDGGGALIKETQSAPSAPHHVPCADTERRPRPRTRKLVLHTQQICGHLHLGLSSLRNHENVLFKPPRLGFYYRGLNRQRHDVNDLNLTVT